MNTNGRVTASGVRRNAGGLSGNPGVLRNPNYLGASASANDGLNQFENSSGLDYQSSRIPRSPQYLVEEYGRVSRRPHSRGAQLQVAGTVVGSWGASYRHSSNSRHQSDDVYGYSHPTSLAYDRRVGTTGYGFDQSSSIPVSWRFEDAKIEDFMQYLFLARWTPFFDS